MPALRPAAASGDEPNVAGYNAVVYLFEGEMNTREEIDEAIRDCQNGMLT